MLTIEKMDFILNNRINGNISDFRRDIKKMTRLNLIIFIDHAVNYRGEKLEQLLISLEGALK